MSSKASIQGEKNQNIKVFVRCRPVNDQERKARSHMCVDVLESRKTVTVKTHHEKTFTFDGTFGKDSTQIDVYKIVVQPLISEVLHGYNCTVFAYGQTGTGKTYTMEGVRSQTLLSWQHDPHAGVVPRALHQIFSEVGDPELTIIKVSFLELYNEELFDLLGSGEAQSSKLKIFEDSTAKGSVVVKGLEEVVVRDRQEVYALLERGASRRQVAATLMNASSSRSHTIFTITVISRDTTDTGEGLMRTGKLNLVDLAGSENIGRSGAQDKRAREAGNINQSLLTLGRVITALVERTPHVPYRESKLTRLLQDSLGGRTKTSIIATISPAHVNLEETLSTLEYAFRAKNIMNRPEVNQKLCKEIVLKHMTDELEQLRRDLIACREKNGFYIDETNYRSMQSRLDLQSEELQKKSEEMTEMVDRIELLKTQIDEINGLFRNTQQQLEIESRFKEIAQTRLKHVNWNYTTAKALIKAHQKTEEKLHQDASKLINTADLAKSDIHSLHDKVQRQQEVERHNTEVLDKLGGILMSSIDSTSRRVEDAFETLERSCSLTDEAIESLQERSKLIQDTECLLGMIIQNHLNSKQRLLDDIAFINQRASESIERLNQSSTDFRKASNTTLSKVTSMLCSNLTDQLNQMKSSLNSDFGQVVALVKHGSVAATQLQTRLEDNVKTSRELSSGMALRASQEAQRLTVERKEMLDVLATLDIVKQQIIEKMTHVFASRESLSAYTAEASQAIEKQNNLSNSLVENFLASHAQTLNQIADHVGRIEKTVEECSQSQQTTTSDCVKIIKNDFDHCQEKLGSQISTEKQNLEEVVKTVKKTINLFTNESHCEVKNLALLSANVVFAANRIRDGKDKLSHLREEAMEILNGNVKKCEITGLTPVRRNYEIPRSLARTQPAHLIQEKMQKKLEEASIEERAALDEGHSVLLDVTASPEALDFESDENNKENSFVAINR